MFGSAPDHQEQVGDRVAARGAGLRSVNSTSRSHVPPSSAVTSVCGCTAMCGRGLGSAGRGSRTSSPPARRPARGCGRGARCATGTPPPARAEFPPPTTRDLLAAAELGLHRGRRVVDAGALEAREVRQVELAVARAGVDHDRACPDRLAAVERQGVRRSLAVQPGDEPRDGEPGAELLRLRLRPAGERLAGDAGREAEIVLDLGRRPRLPAGRRRLQHDRREPLRAA